MQRVLAFLLAGFGLDLASAFTTLFSRRWGKSRGQMASFVLRNVLGIPLWVIGVVLAAREPSPWLFASSSVMEVLAWILFALGAAVQLAAIVALGLPAARPSVDDTLVSRGIYGWMRHPIYSGLLLEFAALLLVKPTQSVTMAVALGFAWAWVQARLEESDLVRRMPAYREYMRRVPRFVPHSSSIWKR